MRNILLVDDDTTFSEIVKGALDHDVYAVTHAADGAKGLEALKTAKPDLILLDMKMPVMGGIEFLQKLKEMVPPLNIPVIILSNDSSLDTISQGAELGAHSYILKSNESLDKIVELIGKQFTSK